MAGNVSEWCQDVWHVNYKGAPADGSARTTDGDQDSRVLRGGSWVGFARDCRGANRDWFMRGHRVGYFGFRLAAGT
jgi:formylglycine-generating enzyme required for sulfatase activity